ncbi:MAG: hypothetical protein KBG48_15780 [Kofleriaceae bacterium]|nr:hypothetical protein [Kofleriaceae bacterium]MBP9862060.1 hypothetical protein [Kofleriaceae bacterium]
MRLPFAFACASLTALVACGDDPAAIVDASIIDSSTIDATQGSDPPPPMVTVLVTSGGTPVSGVPVFFQNADGTLVSATATTSGVASAVMGEGGYATAVLGGEAPQDRPTVTTFAGVKPGDTLRLTVPPPSASMSFALTVPANGTRGHYLATSPCGTTELFTEPGSTVTLDVTLFDCGATTDFLISSDNGDGGPVRAFLARDVAVADGVAVTLNGSYADAPAVDQTYTNLPGGLGVFRLTRELYTNRGRVWSVENTVDVVSQTAIASLVVPPVTGAIGVAIGTRESGGPSYSQILEAPAPAAYTLDANGLFLPVFVDSPGFDQVNSTVSWTQTADGASPDLTMAQIEIGRSSLKTTWRWRIVAPHDGASVRLPVLPGDGAPLNPAFEDFVFVESVTTAKVPGGYDAVRADAFNVGSLGALAGQLTGRVVIEQSQLLFDSVRRQRASTPRRR